MGQKRKNKNDNQLPKYVYRGYKTFDYKPVLENGKRGYFRLCPLDAPISKVWEEWERHQKLSRDTLSWLLNEYIDSHQFRHIGSRQKSNRTIVEQKRQAEFIKHFKLKGGRTFGDVSRKSITRGVIRAYLDKRAEQGSPISGNREKSLISKAWNWALERDKITESNPCKGVARNPEQHRTRYITNSEYETVYKLSITRSKGAVAPPPSYLPVCMELAYLCRMRIGEVLSATKSDILEEGFLTRRTKGSNDAVTLWSDRLHKVINECLSLPGDSVLLIHNKNGEQIRVSTFTSAWQRLMKRAEIEGVKPYPFHDLKAKGVSDFDGDKKTAGGHKSEAMVAVYDRKLKTIKPTK